MAASLANVVGLQETKAMRPTFVFPLGLGEDLSVVGDGRYKGDSNVFWSYRVAQAHPGAHPPAPWVFV